MLYSYFYFLLPMFVLNVVLLENHGLEVKKDKYITYKNLRQMLPEGEKWSSASVELEYWHKHAGPFHSFLSKKILLKGGKTVTLIFAETRFLAEPTASHSIVFLVIGDKMIDWASCCTYSRLGNHDCVVEDIDGDGVPDLGFQNKPGTWADGDKRQHSKPGSKKKWIYAYNITPSGFEPIFPQADRKVLLKAAYDTANQPVKLEAMGLPQTVGEYKMFEITVSATNIGKHDLSLKSLKWFSLYAEKGKLEQIPLYGANDNRDTLKPGETISQKTRLILTEPIGKNVTIHLTFKPTE